LFIVSAHDRDSGHFFSEALRFRCVGGKGRRMPTAYASHSAPWSPGSLAASCLAHPSAIAFPGIPLCAGHQRISISTEGSRSPRVHVMRHMRARSLVNAALIAAVKCVVNALLKCGLNCGTNCALNCGIVIDCGILDYLQCRSLRHPPISCGVIDPALLKANCIMEIEKQRRTTQPQPTNEKTSNH